MSNIDIDNATTVLQASRTLYLTPDGNQAVGLNSYIDPAQNYINGLILLQNLNDPPNQIRTTLNNIGIEQNDALGNTTIDVSWDNLKNLKLATPALRLPATSNVYVVNDTYEANDNNLAKTRKATLSAVSASDPTLALEVLTSGEKATLTQDTLTYLDATGGTPVSASWSSIISGSATPSLSSVLTVGNTATNSIALNNTGVGTNVISLLPNAGASDPQITITDGTTTNTINKTGYTTRNSVQNSTHYLNFSDSSATGTGAIQKTAGISCNPSTNIITATTFTGDLSGNATTATTATTATNATNVAITSDNTSGTYYIPFSKTSGTGNKPLFQDDTTTALTYNPSTSALTATTFAGDLSGNATTSTNISGGAGGQVLYQSASGTTAKLTNGTSGQVLTSAGTTLAPTWTTIATGGNASNTSSQIYSNDFCNTDYAGYLSYPLYSNIYESGSLAQPSYSDRWGVKRFATASTYQSFLYMVSSGVIGSQPNFTLSKLSQDQTGLGWTLIWGNTGNNSAGYYQFFAGLFVSFGQAQFDWSTDYPRAVFWRQWSDTGDWGCKLGNAPTQYFTGSGSAQSQFLVGRIVPTATGVKFYLYNQSTSTNYTPITILYSATSGAGLTSATTNFFYGFQYQNAQYPISEISWVDIDYMGFQTSKDRVYP